jgi:protein-S-isoprenylcysteine O-methyltransferase Ste14
MPGMDASRIPSLGPRGEGWVALQVVLFGAIVVAGLVAGGAWGGTLGLLTAAIGAILVAIGGLLAVKGVLDLGTSLTPLPHPRDGSELIQTGAYRLARHPIYGGLIIAAAGWGLLTASLAALVLAVVLLGFFDLKSRREEQWLEERYPDYAAYRRRTRRLIPGVY